MNKQASNEADGEQLITSADRIFVAGHRGMAGSAICRALQDGGYTQILTASRQELDLLDGAAVEQWFLEQQPTVVVVAAAKVGGIHEQHLPGDFLLDNLKIQTNHRNPGRSGVRRLLFLGRASIPSLRNLFVKNPFSLVSLNLQMNGMRLRR